MRDLFHSQKEEIMVAPSDLADTAVDGTVDIKGWGACNICVASASITEGTTFSVTLTESDDGTTYTAVSGNDVLLPQGSGVTNGVIGTLSNTNTKVCCGYVGYRRYLKVTLTRTSGSGTTKVAAIAVLAFPPEEPTR